MILLHLIALGLLLIYIFKIGGYLFGLSRLQPGNNTHPYSIAVIVPARNEENHIAACLQSLFQQTYPKELYEIIVIDDNSTDKTAEIVKKFIKQHPTNLRLVQHDSHPYSQAYKKAAIEQGIALTQNEIIATTDADCIVQPTWLEGIIRHFTPQVGMVSGYILFHPDHEKNWFHKVQALEFLALTTVGAGAIGQNAPIISNGANLAYRRDVFRQVEGFKDIDHLPSGDDDLLMQKIHRLTDWQIRFAIETETINFTYPCPDLKTFLHQRTRWASKSAHYHHRPSLTLFLIAVYLLYLYIFIGLPLSLFVSSFAWWPWLIFAGKATIDFFITTRGCFLTKQQHLLWYFPLAEILQIPYILWVGIAGLFGNYQWKDRKIKNHRHK